MTTTPATTTARGRVWAALRSDNRLLWVLIAVLIAAALYLSTVQTHINSSGHPYTTDVGEHQNALPRWGTIHHSGYPQWTALGSLFVAVLRLFGVEPAAAVSLWSLLWGLVTVALLAVLACELGAAGPFAALGALAAGLATSVWVNASIAELHTMTMALTLATLWLAVRFGRSGSRADLLWLVFVFSQGIFHQRSILLLAPAVLLLVWPHVLTPFRMGSRTLLAIIGIALLAPLTYLYLPLRVWMGAGWVFGSPGTWDGLLALVFFNNAELVVEAEQSLAGWLVRLRTVGGLLHDDLHPVLLLAGLAGLWLPPRQPTDTGRSTGRLGLALTLVWLPNLLLTVLIWEDRVSDAQLAAKLPVLLMAGLGLALLLQWLWRRSAVVGALGALLVAAALVLHAGPARAFALEITRDRSTQTLVDMVDRLQPAADGRPMTLITPWGTDYWTLTYAQGFEGRLPNVMLVDHNATPQAIIARGDHLLALEKTFFIFPLAYYAEHLGPLYLATAAPGIVEMSPAPIVTEASLAADASVTPADFDLENGIRIVGTQTEWATPDELLVTVYWRAAETPAEGYSVAVHLVAVDPPQSEADIVDQADRSDPVENWYPTTSWRPGEIVRDRYLLTVPAGSEAAAIRVAMYRNDPAAGFVNSPWLSLPLPEKER
ncbi:MAG: DUF2723 domain-containing protein [Anaerolineales bacterium]|nr:DUF2723 domain-containing protein [Anaerolineales bacterium]MCB8935493.1 DUF2723 domain-containing protein [Promineifilum sp.]